MTDRSWHIIAPVLLLIMGLAGILLVAIPFYEVQESPENMYGVVLDAGSSHTTMFIYKWPGDKVNGTGVVSQHSECHVKGGGISSYAGQQGGAARSLEVCLEQALQDIPKSRHYLTPMYLGATAGMRLLNISNYTQSEQILTEVGDKLRTYPFNFRGAAILSGQEEGAYGWVTVNYLLENFIKYGFVGRWLTSGRKTVGALDFGGASTQITFETPDDVEDTRNKLTLRLYGEDYHIYTHSFLCYGRDQVLLKLLAYLIKTQGSVGLISHPCYPVGHNISITLGSVFDSPCTTEHRPTPYLPLSSVTVQGSGNYQQCHGNVSKMFSFDKCPFSKCSFNGIFQPNVTGSFMAFSAFYYTHSFLERSTGIPITSPSLLEDATRTVCHMSFQELSDKVPEERKRLQDYCAISVFIEVLTLKAYRFDKVSFPRISFQKKAGDTSIGWALGYMLSLSNLLPGESIGLRKALLPAAWFGLIFIFVLLLLIGFGSLAVMVRQRKKGGASVI